MSTQARSTDRCYRELKERDTETATGSRGKRSRTVAIKSLLSTHWWTARLCVVGWRHGHNYLQYSQCVWNNAHAPAARTLYSEQMLTPTMTYITLVLIPIVECVKFICSNISSLYVVSEATRSSLRGCKFQKFPGGACPQTPLVWKHYRMLEFPPRQKESYINPWLSHPWCKQLHVVEIHDDWKVSCHTAVEQTQARLLPYFSPEKLLCTVSNHSHPT